MKNYWIFNEKNHLQIWLKETDQIGKWGNIVLLNNLFCGKKMTDHVWVLFRVSNCLGENAIFEITNIAKIKIQHPRICLKSMVLIWK